MCHSPNGDDFTLVVAMCPFPNGEDFCLSLQVKVLRFFFYTLKTHLGLPKLTNRGVSPMLKPSLN